MDVRLATAPMAATVLANLLRQQRGSTSVGTMIMGHDLDGRPRIYYIDDSGACVEGRVFAVGSGSPFAISVLDAELDATMAIPDAIDLAIRAVGCATHRDAFSGGTINVYHMTAKDGWRHVRRVDSRRQLLREFEFKS